MITQRTQFVAEEMAALRQQGLSRPLRVLETPQDTELTVDGKAVLNLSSNNYLGLTTPPRLKSAMIAATDQWGPGSRPGRGPTGEAARSRRDRSRPAPAEP